MYQRALDPEGRFDADAGYGDLRSRVADRYTGDTTALGELVSACSEWSAQEATKYRALSLAPHVTRFLLRNCAPLGLTAGAWLQWIPCAANADTDLILRILALYADDLGVGAPRAARGSVYRRLLQEHQALPPAQQHAGRLATSEEVLTTSFGLAGPLLLLGRRAGDALPEIVGADLCLRATGLLPPLAAIPGFAGDADLDLGLARDGEPAGATGRSLCIATRLQAERPAAADRIRAGFDWALAGLRDWSDALLRELRLVGDPAYDMWRLIWSAAPHAAVYHGNIALDGVRLRDYFTGVDAGPEKLLTALAAGKLVRAGEPERSPIIRGLIAPNGPMFRVFSESDVDTIRRWILSLADGRSGEERRSCYLELHHVQQDWYRHEEVAPSTVASPTPAPPRLAPREAYHLLLTRCDDSALREYALRYTERWLAKARFRLDIGNGADLPQSWNRAQGLRPWLTAQHSRHAERFQDDDQPLPSREALIESTVQTAPLTLIDGAWIQGFTDYGLAGTDSGHFLFRTYWDELGNGQLALNHPKIYRDLLRDMDIELPPTASAEFSGWSGFADESFDLPVYWLCVSRFPKTFRPEILGLNLAMELSGVGGGYRRTSLALKKHGFSTLFVDLHNVIDNVSTGHSAWAADAIDSYLSSIAATMDGDALVRIWDRVRAGYRSLNPPAGKLPSMFARLRTRRGTAWFRPRPARSQTMEG